MHVYQSLVSFELEAIKNASRVPDLVPVPLRSIHVQSGANHPDFVQLDLITSRDVTHNKNGTF